MEDDSYFFFNSNNMNKYNNNPSYIDNNQNNIEIDFDPLPFNTNEEEFQIFGNLNFDIDFANSKHKPDNTNSILNKINNIEDTYYNNIISLPNTDMNLHDKQILEKNLNLIENTLPGLLICFMYKNNNVPISEVILFNIVSNKYYDLRKPNGSKYKVKKIIFINLQGNINKVFKSTLCSSGLFNKVEDDKWFYREKDAIDYVLRVTEKLLTKKLESEKRTAVLIEDTRSTNADKKTPKYDFILK